MGGMLSAARYKPVRDKFPLPYIQRCDAGLMPIRDLLPEKTGVVRKKIPPTYSYNAGPNLQAVSSSCSKFVHVLNAASLNPCPNLSHAAWETDPLYRSYRSQMRQFAGSGLAIGRHGAIFGQWGKKIMDIGNLVKKR